MPLIGSDGRLELPWTSGEAVRGLDLSCWIRVSLCLLERWFHIRQ